MKQGWLEELVLALVVIGEFLLAIERSGAAWVWRGAFARASAAVHRDLNSIFEMWTMEEKRKLKHRNW